MEQGIVKQKLYHAVQELGGKLCRRHLTSQCHQRRSQKAASWRIFLNQERYSAHHPPIPLGPLISWLPPFPTPNEQDTLRSWILVPYCRSMCVKKNWPFLSCPHIHLCWTLNGVCGHPSQSSVQGLGWWYLRQNLPGLLLSEGICWRSWHWKEFSNFYHCRLVVEQCIRTRLTGYCKSKSWFQQS